MSVVPGSYVLALCRGEIDVYSSPTFKAALQAYYNFVPEGKRLIVHLEMVTFIDSTGLNVLIGIYKEVLKPRDAVIVIVTTNLMMLRIFQNTGLTQCFAIFSTIEDAAAGGPKRRDPLREHLE